MKVLITYTWNVTQEGLITKSNELMNAARDRFEAMVTEAWKEFREDPETCYLLIVGQKENGQVRWFFQEFNAMGKHKSAGKWPETAQ